MVSVVSKYLKDTGDTAPHVSVSVSKIHFKSIFPNLAPYERGRHVWKPSNGTHIRPLSFPCFPAASLILLPPSSALNTYHEIRTNCYAPQGGRLYPDRQQRAVFIRFLQSFERWVNFRIPKPYTEQAQCGQATINRCALKSFGEH